MAENQALSFADSIGKARQRLGVELCALAERIQKLQHELTELQQGHERIEQEASHQWDEVARSAELTATAVAEQKAVLESVLAAVRGLVTCTRPDQVFQTLTEEAAQWGVRAAIFDVRGKAAWGASAHGFGPSLSEQDFRSLIVQLRQDNPFRQVCETAGHVEASAETLKKNRNVLEKFKPAPHAPILLLPIRSAGTVTAIFYADPGEAGTSLPVNALMILAEFAGAQIDRLIALSGGFSDEEENVEEEIVQDWESELPGGAAVDVATQKPAPAETDSGKLAPVEPHIEGSSGGKPAAQRSVAEVFAADVHPEVKALESPLPGPKPRTATSEVAVGPRPSAEVAVETLAPPGDTVAAPVIESEIAPSAAPQAVDVIDSTTSSFAPTMPVNVLESSAPPAPPIPAGFDVAQLSESEQKVHKDAKRFAKLLVSEIELYNKAKVAEGRKNRDLYKRLKTDIDRSRQTFEKRFGKALSNQVDYFHDELVKTLAVNDAEVLGPEYPGPAE
ncbi:MAG TPA: hypothetical protein VEN79_12845 [Terriglobia bacterium]|nr:hypothetical protein [Terriglobia bacterium]